jgi:hypothetical protein
MDTQTIGIANMNNKPTKQILTPIADKGISMAQKKQGRQGKARIVKANWMQRQIQSKGKHNPIPSTVITPTEAMPKRHNGANNSEQRQQAQNPKRSIKIRQIIKHRINISPLIPISPRHILSISPSSYLRSKSPSGYLYY